MWSKFTFSILVICLLSATLSEAMAVPKMGLELRCQCVKTESNFIRPHDIQSVELFPSGPQCENLEVIATLKDGQLVCLDPSSPWVQKIITKILENSGSINLEDQN